VEAMDEYKYCDMFGNPIPDWAQAILDKTFQDITIKEKRLYDKLVHRVERYFENWNRESCSHCRDYHHGQTHYGGNTKLEKEAGCCAFCDERCGHFTCYDDVEKSIRSNLLPYRIKKNGFFDLKHHQCLLPRQLRSFTCLAYSCEYGTHFKRVALVHPISIFRLCAQKYGKIPLEFYRLIDSDDDPESLDEQYYAMLDRIRNGVGY
jgi:hypothetical protein